MLAVKERDRGKGVELSQGAFIVRVSTQVTFLGRVTVPSQRSTEKTRVNSLLYAQWLKVIPVLPISTRAAGFGALQCLFPRLGHSWFCITEPPIAKISLPPLALFHYRNASFRSPTRLAPVTQKGKFNSNTVTVSRFCDSHRFIYQPLVRFPPYLSLSSRLPRRRAKMLFTPAFTYLSLAFNLGTLLLLHGSDPNLATTKQNVKRSIQTIELAAMKSWNNIATHYEAIVSPPPASSSPSFVNRAEWIYRGCVVRIIHSLNGSICHPSRTPSASLPSLPPSASLPSLPPSASLPSLPPSASLPSFPLSSSPVLLSTSLSIRTPTELIPYIPSPRVCLISNAPFVIFYYVQPWQILGFMETHSSHVRIFVFYILVALANYVSLKVGNSFIPGHLSLLIALVLGSPSC